MVRIILFLLAVSAAARSQVTLTVSPNPATSGAPVTLTATVPTGATGKVTFYDGAKVLGIGVISGTQAMLTTIELQTGTRSLRAYYPGNGAISAGRSTAVALPVNSRVSLGFRPTTTLPVAGDPVAVVTGDFNRDGKLDVAAATTGIFWYSLALWIMLGNGDGTFQPALRYSLFWPPGAIASGTSTVTATPTSQSPKAPPTPSPSVAVTVPSPICPVSLSTGGVPE